MQLFGTSGIRGVVDSGLVQLALKVGLALGQDYSRVVVGSDTRTSSDAMKHSLTSGLLAAGAKCCDAGVVPTPTLALAARNFAAGAVITASHNPPEYNGIKLVNPDGSAFDAKQRRQVEEIVLNGSFAAAPWHQMESKSVLGGAIEQHIERILADFPTPLKLKVVVDCGCGATSVITPYLLKKLGCEVIALNSYPCGLFPHDVEPIEANLGDLIRATLESGADLGIAHDGDGDRMMLVDDMGRFVSGDKLMAIFAREMGAKKIVTTIDASMVLDEMGFDTIRTRVGDIYVSEELKRGGDFGGEPSGSWVFPRVSLCPDGIFAAAQAVATANRHKLSQLADSIPSYPIFRASIKHQGIAMTCLEGKLEALKPKSLSNTDGLKLNFDDGWALIRASGTEPKIRLTVEAKSAARARQLYENIVRIIEEGTKGN